eukprot:COSAG02_NODE_1266_length_13539_cov_216.818824_15_plen_62_part_00
MQQAFLSSARLVAVDVGGVVIVPLPHTTDCHLDCNQFGRLCATIIRDSLDEIACEVGRLVG